MLKLGRYQPQKIQSSHLNSNHHLISPYCIMADKLPFWIWRQSRNLFLITFRPMHGIWNLRRGFQISGTGLKSQSLVGFRSPWAVFQIPKPRIPDSTGRIFLDFGIRTPLHWTTPCYCFCFHYEIFISCSINRSTQSKSSSYFDLLDLRNANISQENKVIKIIKFIKIHR